MSIVLICIVASIIIALSVGSFFGAARQHISMENTAKNFALQLGSLITLYVSISALIMLLFGVITVQYPDPANGVWEYESAASGIRFGIAILIVFFPAYILLTRAVNTIRRTEHGAYLTLTKWLIYLSLVVGGGVLLGDLVALVNSYLNGELTIRFALKALTMFFVVGSAFMYYLFDARGYWQTHEKHSIQYGAGIALLVVIALVLGFKNTATPTEIREQKLDTAQINDLANMQTHIEEYYRLTSTVPATVEDAYKGLAVPVAPEGRAPYTYARTSDTSFELCATFYTESSAAEKAQYAQQMYYDTSVAALPYTWEHAKGEWCFERVIQNPTYTPQGKTMIVK